MTGQCRCGQVAFEVASPALLTVACHCRGCQRMTGSAFSLGAIVPKDALRITRGELAAGGLQTETRHAYCAHCKSWISTQPQGVEAVVVRSMMLDGRDWDTPYVEICTSEKLPWATTPAARSFSGFPAAEDYVALIGEFTARAGV